MNEKLTFTKAIKMNRLRATEMQVGESVRGVLKGFKPNNYGKSNLIIEVMGKEVEVFAAGNLNFLEADTQKGKFNLGAMTVITRVDDIQTKNGFTSSHFLITQQGNNDQANRTTTPTAQTAAANAPSTQDKIKAILAKQRGQN